MEGIKTFLKEKKKIVIGVLCAVVVIAGLGIYLGSNRDDNLTATEIFNAMLEDKDVKKQVGNSKDIKSVDDDPVGLFNEKNMYISKVKFVDNDIEEASDGDEYNGGAIIVFKNTEDLKLYEKYIELIKEEIENKFSKDEYGETFVGLLMQNASVNTVVEGNAMLLMNINLSEDANKTYKKAFKAVLKDRTYSQEEVPDKKQIESVTKTLKEKAKKEVEKTSGSVEDAAKYIITMINDGLAKAETSLNEKDLEDVNDLIEKFNAPYFATSYQQWIEKTSELKGQIAEIKLAEEAKKRKQEELKANTHCSEPQKLNKQLEGFYYGKTDI